MIAKNHPIHSILSNEDLNQLSNALHKLNTMYSQEKTNNLNPLELFGGLLSNIDVQALKEEYSNLKKEKQILTNLIENISGEKQHLITIHSECKKLPKENQVTKEILESIEASPLKDVRTVPLKMDWNLSTFILSQEEFSTDFQWIGGSKSKCDALQVYNNSKERLLLLTFKYNQECIQRIDQIFVVSWTKGKLKSIEIGSISS